MAVEKQDDYESLNDIFGDEEEVEDYFGEDHEEDEDESDQDEDDSDEESEDDSEDDDSDEEDADEGEAEEENDEENEDDSDEKESEEEEVALPQWAMKIKEKFPDRQFESLDDYDAANAEYIESLESNIETNRQTEEQLVNIFNQHQELAQVFAYLNKGYSPRAALVAAGFSPEDFVIQDGDEDAEQLVEAKVNARHALAEKKKREEKIEANSKRSQGVISQFQAKKGIKDSVHEEFMGKIENVFNRFLEADIDESTLEMFWKALNYDKDKKAAEDHGRIKGRNEKIAIQKKKRKGDGVARLSSAQAKTSAKKVVYDDPFAEILDRVNQMD